MADMAGRREPPASAGLVAPVLRHTLLSILGSVGICSAVYAVVDPTLFSNAIAIAMPILCPALVAPAIAYHLLSTRRRVAEAREEAEQRARELETMLSERDRTLNLIGHDLAHQLVTVATYAEALGQTDLNANTRLDRATEITRAARAAQEIVRELLVWDQHSIAMARTERRPTELRDLIDAVVRLTRGLAATHGILLEARGPRAVAAIDQRQIEAALRNLVALLVEHGTRGGVVTVTVSATGGGTVDLVVEGRPTALPEDMESPPGAELVREVARRHGGGLTFDIVERDVCRVVLRLPIGGCSTSGLSLAPGQAC